MKPLEHLTILLVEDTEDAREPMRLLLEQQGARVLEAANGSQALEALAADRADIVLCDLRMPIMDGFEFMRALTRADTNHPPVVAISGLARNSDRDRTRAAGFQAHLAKPFDFETLVTTMRASLEARASA